jgi:hypothetical protein
MDAQEPAPSYESALQAVGGYLDSQCASEFQLLETPRGLVVHFRMQGGRPEWRLAFFKFSDLRGTGVDIGLFRKIRHPLGSADRQYRHLLWAIGHELDTTRAMSILLDELPQSLLITYEYDDPGHGYVLRKRMALAGPRDRERLVTDARHRSARLRSRLQMHWQPVTDPDVFT